MKKRNFWAKCIAFLLVVVMVLSEQNITTLGETIGSYAQERMTGSSEQETERAIIKEDSSQESSSAAGSSASSSETSQAESSATQNDSQQTQQTGKNSGAGSAQTDQGTSAPSGQQALTNDASGADNADAQNEKKTADNKKNNQQNTQKKKKEKKAEQNDGQSEEKNRSFADVAEEYYGENGTRNTAAVTIEKQGDSAQVRTGERVNYIVEYTLAAAAYYNYGDQREPLFDTYDDTRIILHLPDNMSIVEGVEGNLNNVTEVIPPEEDSDSNDWILVLNDSIRADSDTVGSFVMTLQVDENGSLPAGHLFEFGEAENLMEIETNFTIKDRTDSSNITDGKAYYKKIATTSELADLTSVTDDEWMITKSAGNVTSNEAQGTVTVTFNLQVGLQGTDGSIITNESTYARNGRVPFVNEDNEVTDSITLTETPSLQNREGETVTAQSITVTPQFGDQTAISVPASGGNISIPVNTCGNQASLSGVHDYRQQRGTGDNLYL